ncbi:hypothetical protein ZOSMA_27G00740 [Zostera marina]|uniref:Uncharacterized protein n=1 Tax=Zostera marina TaxID=29655 RepID=A0A0K9PFK8_ZOSMR|nr:hypothetical protein ZOSMA_27G00740 [Zostera marina]
MFYAVPTREGLSLGILMKHQRSDGDHCPHIALNKKVLYTHTIVSDDGGDVGANDDTGDAVDDDGARPNTPICAV